MLHEDKTIYRHNGRRLTKEEWDALPNRLPRKLNKLSNVKIYGKKEFNYISPMSGKEISCHGKRREEMKKYGVREVAPDEYNKVLKDQGFYDRKHPE